MNEFRELTLEGREPGEEGDKQYINKDDLNMEIKKIESDIENNRTNSLTNVINTIPDKSQLGRIEEVENLDNESLYDRNNPEIIKAFRENPYTKPLDST